MTVGIHVLRRVSDGRLLEEYNYRLHHDCVPILLDSGLTESVWKYRVQPAGRLMGQLHGRLDRLSDNPANCNHAAYLEVLTVFQCVLHHCIQHPDWYIRSVGVPFTWD